MRGRSGFSDLYSLPLITGGTKGLFKNNMAKIALRFGLDLVVAISAKPQA
jgi:hypothetical protein